MASAARLCQLHGVRLLLLFGSRGRGQALESSDWDFAFLGTANTDPAAVAADLSLLVGTDRLDIVDLARASGVLRYHAARDGQMVFADHPETFERFWWEAVDFWCDAEPTLRAAYAAMLADTAAAARANA